MSKQTKNNTDYKDMIIKIILVIIIIFLLLHNCSLIKKKGTGENENGNVNIIDITCNDNKCQQPTERGSVDCLEDDKNSVCLVPNFVGMTKKDVLKWLSSVSNTIEVEIRTVENSEYSDGTVLEQSVSGVSVKKLMSGKTKLVITIVNNGSLVDCQANSKNNKCVLPNFSGKTKSNVENWLDGISNNIKVRYVYVDSNKKAGTIIDQSVESGTSVKDILNNDETVIIYISNGNKDSSNHDHSHSHEGGSTTPDEDDEELEDDFYVSDKEITRWHNETNLKIFKDSQSISKVRGKIAPESSGTYKFIVNNGTRYNLKYSITFTESNHYHMNMKYKLKKGDTYLIDHYVSYNQLNLEDMSLSSQNSDTYYLEWKWVGDNDNNDTHIGDQASNGDVPYELKIDVEAESV